MLVNKNLANLLQRATRNQAESTLAELFETFGLSASEGTLAKVFHLSNELSQLGLRLVPGVERGELDTIRRVEIMEPLPITETEVVQDLRRGEDEDLELKSSLLYDHVRAKNDPQATVAQLKSEAVLYSCLRAIAAFLNCSGGVLYVGADDQGSVLGIEYDFPCITENKEKQNPDAWQLHLRSHVQDRFKDGLNINDYVSCAIIPIGARLVARIEVAPRTKMAFLTEKGGCRLYRRQGNRSVDVPIDLVEEFIDFRRNLRA